MGLLGILSLIQIGFLPGILISLSIPHLDRQDRFLLALPLSCVVNYFLVLSLTLIGLYNQFALLAILAIEATLLALFLHRRKTTLKPEAQPLLDLEPLFPRDGSKFGTVRILFVAMALAYIFQTWKQVGTVFTDGDVVQLWNRWAIDWFNGVFPRQTQFYPQLLPALYSMTYQFIGTTQVQFFAKMVPAFFPLMALAIFIRLANLLKEDAPAILLAAVFLVITFMRMMGSGFPFNGYADFPLAYFSLVVCYGFCLLHRRAQQFGAPLKDSLLFWCAALAGGMVLVKHSGGYLALLFPVAWYYYIGRQENTRAAALKLATLCALIFIIVGHWYIYKLTQIVQGTDASNLVQYGQAIDLLARADLPWHAKLIRGVEMISRKISWAWLLLFGFGITHILGRALALWIFLPFFTLWALFASYDYRNLSLALPALSVILALGTVKIYALATKNHRAARFLKPATYLVLASIMVAASVKYTSTEISEKLVQDSLYAQRKIQSPELNELLYAHFRYRPEPGKVATNYYALGFLPGIEDRYVKTGCSALETAYHDLAVRYILISVSHWCPQTVLDKLEAASRTGIYKKLFAYREHVFYEITVPDRESLPESAKKLVQ